MKYKLIYRKNKILVIMKGNNIIVDILGVNKYLFKNKKVQYLFINKNKLKNWLMKDIEISVRVGRICNINGIINV